MNNVVMPKLSDMMEEGKILSWSKKVGDTIKKGDLIAEVETEKVNIEIESFYSGTLLEILVPAGTVAPVGGPIAVVGAANEVAAEPPKAAAPAPAATAPSPVAATSSTSNGHASVATMAQSPAQSAVYETADKPGRLKSSPLARRLAEEHDINLTQLRGTGPEGRIVKDDVLAALAAGQVNTFDPVMSQPANQTVVTTGDVEIIPLSNMRRTIAKRLQQSMQNTPHFYVTMAMNASRLAELRVQLNGALESQGQALRVSFNDLIVMAVARSLVMHPEINVTFDTDRLIRHKSVHIGVAVALESGLIVPVVRDANQRSITDLAREIRRLADAARNNKLRPDEFFGSTFTISNLGMIDVESFTAIINPPEAAILAVGAIVPTPVVVDNQIVIHQQIKMTLSSDHRAIDGAQAAYFMRDLKHLIETPATLLL